MSESPQGGEDDRRILELAVAKGKLTAAQVATLQHEASGSTCDLAIKQNLISAADVEILRPLSSPTRFLPDYEFLDIIGEGAIGTVYKARQIRLNRSVAIKLLKRSALDNHTATARSQIEAQLTARMQHPNIVAVHDYGVQQGRVFLAMEFVDGQSLLEYIEQRGAFEWELALQLVRQIVSALSHAADNGVIHRDIKPANVLLTNDVPGLNLPPSIPAAKVLDFGLAFESQNEDATRLTADGAALGTPSYVAPEQLMNSRVDERADIYALGATLYHMLTGRQPFGDGNAFQALAAKMQGDEDWRGDIGNGVPGAVQQLVVDMTHHAIEKRIAGYDELTERVEAILQNRVSNAIVRSDGRVNGTAEVPGDAAVRARHWSWVRRVGGLVLFACVLYGGLQILKITDPPAMSQLIRRPIEVVREHSLFDGISSPHNAVVRGNWVPTQAVDGGYVLEGRDNAVLRCKAPDSVSTKSGFFRYRIGVNPLKEAVTDICLAIDDFQGCHLLRFQNQTVQLGVGSLQSPEFQPVANVPPTKLFQADEGPTYFSVVIDHQSNGWFVSVEGSEIGKVIAYSNERAEVLLRTTTGTTHFDGLSFVETEPAAPPG